MSSLEPCLVSMNDPVKQFSELFPRSDFPALDEFLFIPGLEDWMDGYPLLSALRKEGIRAPVRDLLRSSGGVGNLTPYGYWYLVPMLLPGLLAQEPPDEDAIWFAESFFLNASGFSSSPRQLQSLLANLSSGEIEFLIPILREFVQSYADQTDIWTIDGDVWIERAREGLRMWEEQLALKKRLHLRALETRVPEIESVKSWAGDVVAESFAKLRSRGGRPAYPDSSQRIVDLDPEFDTPAHAAQALEREVRQRGQDLTMDDLMEHSWALGYLSPYGFWFLLPVLIPVLVDFEEGFWFEKHEIVRLFFVQSDHEYSRRFLSNRIARIPSEEIALMIPLLDVGYVSPKWNADGNNLSNRNLKQDSLQIWREGQDRNEPQ